jgi:hypothetical protein
MPEGMLVFMRVDEMCGMCGCGFVQMPFMLINVDFGHFG